MIYGSLVPLNFTPHPLSDAISAFQVLPFLDLSIGSRSDWAANILLFIPLSFFAARLATARLGSFNRLMASSAIVLGCIVLAFTIEFAQLFFPPRTASKDDMLAQSLGGLIGIFLQARWGASVERWFLGLFQRESRTDRTQRLLHGYLLLLFIFSIMPLDLTISPIELYHKWSEGRVILMPFSGLFKHWSELLYSLITDTLIWIPAGLLWSIRAQDSIFLIAQRGLVAGFVIEVFQLFVYSRITDITDVLLAGVGSMAGAALILSLIHIYPKSCLTKTALGSIH